ncbi:MAG: putative rane protein [Deltaproteobacteria bacterium]|nr:putative rane protein [Deltaproteobacteria bacterium]
MLIVLHLALMIAAVISFTAGVGIAMFARKKKNWLKLHKAINTSGVIIGLAGAAMAFANVLTSAGNHLSGLHHRVGFIAIILFCITLYLGFYSFKAANKTAVRTTHRWSGRFSLIAMLAALIMGLKMIGVL